MAAIATSFASKGTSGSQSVLDSIAKNQAELINVIKEQGKQNSKSIDKLGVVLSKQQSGAMLQLGAILVEALKKE